MMGCCKGTGLGLINSGQVAWVRVYNIQKTWNTLWCPSVSSQRCFWKYYCLVHQWIPGRVMNGKTAWNDKRQQTGVSTQRALWVNCKWCWGKDSWPWEKDIKGAGWKRPEKSSISQQPLPVHKQLLDQKSLININLMHRETDGLPSWEHLQKPKQRS